jgi:hypothetical protein
VGRKLSIQQWGRDYGRLAEHSQTMCEWDRKTLQWGTRTIPRQSISTHALERWLTLGRTNRRRANARPGPVRSAFGGKVPYWSRYGESWTSSGNVRSFSCREIAVCGPHISVEFFTECINMSRESNETMLSQMKECSVKRINVQSDKASFRQAG